MKNVKELDEKITIKKTKAQIKDFAESTVEMFGGKKEEIKEGGKYNSVDDNVIVGTIANFTSICG